MNGVAEFEILKTPFFKIRDSAYQKDNYWTLKGVLLLPERITFRRQKDSFCRATR